MRVRAKRPRTVRMVVRFWSANLDMFRPGDAEQIAHLEEQIPDVGVIFTQEQERGRRGNRFHAVGLRLRHMRRWVVGKVGVHREVARSWLGKLRMFNLHGLHRRTAGRIAQALYYAIIVARLRALNLLRIDWALGGDGNTDGEALARRIGGGCVAWVADGDRVVWFITSKHVQVVDHGTDNTAMRQGKTDHPATYIDVVLDVPIRQLTEHGLRRIT